MKKQTKKQPAIDAICKMPFVDALTKASMLKEAVASCALDGETQCGTIEPQTKEQEIEQAFQTYFVYKNNLKVGERVIKEEDYVKIAEYLWKQGKAQALKQVQEIIDRRLQNGLQKINCNELKAELEKLK